MRTPRFASITLLMLGVASASACGGAAARPVPPVSAAPAPLGPLASLLPDGARLVVVAHPAQLFDTAAVPRIVDALVLPGGLDRFALRTGVDPRRLTEAVYAEYDGGVSLILVRGPIDAELVVAEAGERMSTVESSADAPLVRRAGFFSDERRELVALAGDVVAVTGGPAVVELAALLACVTSSPRHCRGAFAGADAAALLRAHGLAPLSFYAPTGVTLPEGFGTASLLAGTRSLSVVVDPTEATAAGGSPGEAVLVVDLALRGRFPSGAEENFRALLQSLGESDLGGVVGLRQAAEHLSTQRDQAGLQLHTTVAVASLVHGLQVLFAGEISAIIDVPAVSPGLSPTSRPEVGSTIENHK